MEDAWRDYLKAIADCSWVLHHPDTPKDAATTAAGIANLHRLAQLAWELAFEYRNVDAPLFFPVSVRNLSHGWNSSNAVYWIAVIDGGRAYAMSGDRGRAPFMEIGIYDNIDGFAEPGSGGGHLHAAVTERALGDGQGEIALRVSPDVDGPLRTTPGPQCIFVRQYAHDWAKTPPSAGFALRALNPLRAGESYESRLRRGLQDAPRYLANHVALYHGLAVSGRARGSNVLFEIPLDMNATLPSGHRFVSGYFDLADGEILSIAFRPEDAPYWSLELGDFWGQTFDYDRTLDGDADRFYDRPANRSHLHDRDAVREADGSVKIQVGAGSRPAGCANWLDTRGHKVGIVIYRQLRKLDCVPRFETRVIARGDVA